MQVAIDYVFQLWKVLSHKDSGGQKLCGDQKASGPRRFGGVFRGQDLVIWLELHVRLGIKVRGFMMAMKVPHE